MSTIGNGIRKMPTDQCEHYPRISQAILLLVLFVLVVVAFGVVLGILGGILGYPFHRHPAAMAAANLAAAAFVLRRGLKKTEAPFAQVFPFTPFRASLLFPMSLTIIGLHILLSEMDNLLRTVLPMPAWLSELFSDLAAGHTSLWGSVLALVIVAPLTEELLFRGLILRGFLSHYTATKAVLASAMLFALVHLNPWQAPAALVLGLLLAWWFLRTRSLLPCLFGHALGNALPFIFGVILQLKIRGFTGEFSREVEFQPLWFDALGILLAGVGLWLLTSMFRGARLPPRDAPLTSPPDPDS